MSLATDLRRRIASRASGPGSRRASGLLIGGVTTALALTGCGSSASTSSTSAASAAATAPPVLDSPPTTPAARRRLRAEELAIHRQVLASLRAAARRRGHYGGLPVQLRQTTRPVDRTLTADAHHPALSIEGESVRLRLAAGQAMATVIGPYVPHRLQGTGVRTAPVRFIVRLVDVAGHIPLAPRLFTITDELGQTLQPSVRFLPTAGRPGSRTVALNLTTTLPIGNGTLRYSPTGGPRYLAAWDFDVETD